MKLNGFHFTEWTNTGQNCVKHLVIQKTEKVDIFFAITTLLLGEMILKNALHYRKLQYFLQSKSYCCYLMYTYPKPWTFWSGKGHFYGENVSLCSNLAEGTTAKALGTAAIAVGVVGYWFPLKQSDQIEPRTIGFFQLSLHIQQFLILDAHLGLCLLQG